MQYHSSTTKSYQDFRLFSNSRKRNLKIDVNDEKKFGEQYKYSKNSPSLSRGNVTFHSQYAEPQSVHQNHSAIKITPKSITPHSIQFENRSLTNRRKKAKGINSYESKNRVSSKATDSYITGIKSPILEDTTDVSDRLYDNHLKLTFQALNFIKTFPPVEANQLRAKRVNLAKRHGYKNKKTLVIDLDETLVHCGENVVNPDVILPIRFPTGDTIQAKVNIRPFAIECLREANRDFEVIVFTASHQCYADVILNYLDPDWDLIHHRLYRDSCLNINGIYVKDLRILGNRRLQDIIIVDNSAYSFAYQLDNGVPIISWHQDRSDRELYKLIDYLKVLANTDDVREINRQTFHLRTFCEDYIQRYKSQQNLKS